jgi:hypothetical protein
MIEQFNDIEMRDSGIIYNSVLEQIKKLYIVDPEKAGELAISAIELTLTGQISSDDMIVELMLEPTKISVGKNHAKYDQKVESSRHKKIVEQKLDQIAELSDMGMRQREIAERLGLTQQTVSYRLGVIRSTYPELLQKNDILPKNLPNIYQNTKDTKLTKNTKFCTVGTNDDVCKIGEVNKNADEESWKNEFSF